MGIQAGMIRSGELDERITLQAKTKAGDSMGSFVVTWADVATIWAKAWTVSSSEKSVDMSIDMIRVQKFKIRYRNVLSPAWRIQYQKRHYNITGIDPDIKNGSMFLTCKEVVG